MAPSFEHRLTVTYEETNAVGNVYYANHIRWQGKVRELFLLTHAPGVLGLIGVEFNFITKSVHCDYERELRAFDRVAIRMRLARRGESSMHLLFDYFRIDAAGGEERIARGAQELVCMDLAGRASVPLPAELVEALKPFEPVRGAPEG
jgi:enediyne biosynthesis thioesterase